MSLARSPSPATPSSGPAPASRWCTARRCRSTTTSTARSPDFLWFERLLEDQGSGLNKPAAVIVETVQGEGGINVARAEWLRALADLCQRHDMLLIVDDIQMGCGRTGAVLLLRGGGHHARTSSRLSKSISGYGLPMSLCLFKPELDVWEPGEHNGTFRGNNPAFVTATAALDTYWADGQHGEADPRPRRAGRAGAARDRATSTRDDRASTAAAAWSGAWSSTTRRAPTPSAARAFELGLLMETSGPESEVVKLLPAAHHHPRGAGRGPAHPRPRRPRDRLTGPHDPPEPDEHDRTRKARPP